MVHAPGLLTDGGLLPGTERCVPYVESALSIADVSIRMNNDAKSDTHHRR